MSSKVQTWHCHEKHTSEPSRRHRGLGAGSTGLSREEAARRRQGCVIYIHIYSQEPLVQIIIIFRGSGTCRNVVRGQPQYYYPSCPVECSHAQSGYTATDVKRYYSLLVSTQITLSGAYTMYPCLHNFRKDPRRVLYRLGAGFTRCWARIALPF